MSPAEQALTWGLAMLVLMGACLGWIPAGRARRSLVVAVALVALLWFAALVVCGGPILDAGFAANVPQEVR